MTNKWNSRTCGLRQTPIGIEVLCCKVERRQPVYRSGDYHSTDENGIPIVPEPDGNFLRPVDIQAMVSANLDILQIIEQTTVKKILAVYEKYKGRLDLFHVAFSGGKDSAVLLDLVKKRFQRAALSLYSAIPAWNFLIRMMS
jgi:hypothetical protein